MKKWLRRIRGAVGMGLTWAAGWAFAGVLLGVTSLLLPGLLWDSFFEIFDAPLPALAIPGFVAGVLFSAVVGIAGRGRRFNQLSLPRFAAWGAVGGLLLSLVPAAMVTVGLASVEGGRFSIWQLTSAISVPFILLSAVSASAYLSLARKAQGRELPDPSDGAAAALAEGDADGVLGGGDFPADRHSAARHGEQRG